MSSFLPQHDPNLQRRRAGISINQALYTYNYTHVSPLAVVDRVPIHDEFSFRWIETVAKRVLVGLANRAELASDPHCRDHHLGKHRLLSGLLTAGEVAISDIRNLVSDALRFEVRIGARPDRPESLEDYNDLFRTIGLPPVTQGCCDDRVFGWMRLAGPNPLVITRLNCADSRIPVTDRHLQSVVPGYCLNQALAEGRIYLADYAMLDVASTNDYPHGQKYLYAPLALFVVAPESGQLLPFAIQCRQQAAPENPILTPGDGFNWLIAKTVVEMADGNMHEAFSHLGRTHLLMEPFVVTTYRQLAATHPVSVLLSPHFEGTLAINEAAWQHLVANKGAVEKLFSAPIGAARGLAAAGVQTASINKMLLPDTFHQRGVEDTSVLPDYPFRDDSLLYWDAIRTWVIEYLAVYYLSDNDVACDTELQAWGIELASQSGGRISGLPGNGQFSTCRQLIDVLTLVIYTCSVQHAAVNFPQYDLMSYVPNMPLGLYSKVPTSQCSATEADYLAMLPPLDMAELQMELGYLLGTVHYTQLGQYGGHCFRDQRVEEPLRRFVQAISSIGGRIDERNQHRSQPYTTLKPDGIPQSINI